MDTNYNGHEIYYHDKNKFMKSIFVWNIFFISIIILFQEQWNIYTMVINSMIVLVLATLLMVITHSNNINPKPIYMVFKISIVVIMIVSALDIVSVKYFNIVSYLLEFSPNSINVSIYFLLIYHVLAKVRSIDDNNILVEYKILLCIIMAINLLNNLYFKDNIFIVVINKVIMEMFLITAMINTAKEKIIDHKNINVLKFTIIVLFINTNLIEIFNIINEGALYLIIIAFDVSIVISALILIINRLIKNIYSFIFKDIHDINKNLSMINYDVMLRNEELENSKLEIDEKQKKYRNLLRLIPKAIIIVKVDNGRVIYCNHAFMDLIGVSEVRNIINRKVKSIINLDFNFKNFTNLNEKEIYFGSTIESDKKVLEVRLSNYNKNMQEITMIFKDITERKKIEEIKGEIERKKINDSIKTNFLANVSHDFKIPINVIYSATQLEEILISNNDVLAVSKYNLIAKKNCLTLINLTNNIIDISKISSEHVNLNLESGNVVEFVEEKISLLLEYALLNNINIIFDTEEEELNIKFDKSLMERILLNLISNAIKFTPKGGTINIDISKDENSIFIAIKDTGEGMDGKFVKELFNKYSMNSKGVSQNTQGTGIGLYVVYNLVNLQKGEIWVDSKVGKGTTFTMKFCRE